MIGAVSNAVKNFLSCIRPAIFILTESQGYELEAHCPKQNTFMILTQVDTFIRSGQLKILLLHLQIQNEKKPLRWNLVNGYLTVILNYICSRGVGYSGTNTPGCIAVLRFNIRLQKRQSHLVFHMRCNLFSAKSSNLHNYSNLLSGMLNSLTYIEFKYWSRIVYLKLRTIGDEW